LANRRRTVYGMADNWINAADCSRMSVVSNLFGPALPRAGAAETDEPRIRSAAI